MLTAIRIALIAVALLNLASGAGARAGETLRVEAASELIVLRLPGLSHANVRALPDPRSAPVLQVPAGATALRATGATKLYGDTWWVEIQAASVTGWLNARLLGRSPGNTPLQPYVDIDDLQPIANYTFKSTGYQQSSVTSFDECARACVGDPKCVAIEHRRADATCKLYDQRADAVSETGVEIAAKPAKTPSGGWAIQSAARFNRTQEQRIDADGYRDFVAHTVDECAAGCALEQRCLAFAYQRKKRLCSAIERVGNLAPRAGFESGIRQIPAPLPDAIALATSMSAPAVASRNGNAKDPADQRTAGEQFRQLYELAGQGATFATGELGSHGRVTFTLLEPAFGGPMHAAAMPRVLEGTLHNLAAVIGRTNGRIVHLAFYAGPASAPVILASSSHPTADAAESVAVKLQKDVDDIAKAVGLGVDPLSLLKPLRR